MKVSFHSFGCKVNQYEVQLLRENFSLRGYRVTGQDQAQRVVINSCCVTAKAEKECRSLLRRLSRTGREVWLTGCLARKAEGQLRQEFPQVKILDKEFLLGFLLAPAARTIRSFADHTRAFVKIEEGCENFCSYCIVPSVRGRVRSRPEKEILDEISTLAGNGYREIVLTGTDLGAYGSDTGTDLLSLLKKVFRLPNLPRVRLSSLELLHVSEGLIRFLSAAEKFCPHFHIPLQSGSDRILKLMARRYTSRDYLAAVGRIRKANPSATFTTDIIVGFPGEQEADWLETCRAVEEARFLKLHIFPYSVRPATPAGKLPGAVPASIKKAREKELFQLGAAVSRKEQSRFLGTVQEVLVERKIAGGSGARWFGRAPNYLPVIFPSAVSPNTPPGDDLRARPSAGDLTNAIIPVVLKGMENGCLTGVKLWRENSPR